MTLSRSVLSRSCRAGGALGTILLILAALALIAFIALTTARRDKGASEGAGASGDGPPHLTLPDDPVNAQKVPETAQEIWDTYPLLAFQEHSQGLPGEGTWRGYPTLADLDGDGDLDLVASNREEDGVSAWRFTSGAPWERSIEGLPRDMSYGPTSVADVNSDQIPDLLIGDHTMALRVFLGDGDLNWTETKSEIVRPSLLMDIEVTELNGDGIPDLGTVSHFKGGVQIYVGDGSGGFNLVEGAEELIGQKGFGRDVEWLDLNSDGTDDLIVSCNSGLRAFLCIIEGDQFTWKEVSDGLPNPKIGNSIYGVDVATFDKRENHPQLVCATLVDPSLAPEDADGVCVYAYDPSAESWSRFGSGLHAENGHKDVVAADFNDDGNMDLLTASLAHGRLIYLGDGTGGFTPKGRIPGTAQVRLVVGDINQDGLPDVAVVSSKSKRIDRPGGVQVFLNKPDIWK